MTFPFEFSYENRKHYFIWDSESGSLHNVDYVAFLLAKKLYPSRYCEFTDVDRLALSKVDEREIIETQEALKELENNGLLNTECNIFKASKDINEIKALCLHICNDCNLRCSYCFADDGTYHTSEKAFMSLEVGKAAIDFLIEKSGKRHSLEVDFFGGEPLLNLDVVKGIVAYAREREKTCDKVFSFTMTTNCLLLNDDTVEWLNKEMHNIVLSIDGRKEIHDQVRKTVNGVSAYEVIARNALKMAKARGDKSYYARGTFTAKNLDFASDVIALNDMGFEQISVEPVVTPIKDLAITQEHIPTILKEYEKLAQLYIQRRKEGKFMNFFHFYVDLEGGPCISKRLTGCGSGCEYLAVTPTGEIYPCHIFAEMKPYKIGNVFDKVLDTQIQEKFSHNIVTLKPECTDCPAKYYCSGGCCANNLFYAGSMNTPYDISCQMMRKRFELGLGIWAVEHSS